MYPYLKNLLGGGVSFDDTQEGGNFWKNVLDGDFELFFSKHPKNTFPREMIVWDSDVRYKKKKEVICDLGSEYAYRYIVENGFGTDGKKHFSFHRFAGELPEEPKTEEPQRCFILTFQTIGKHEMFSHKVELPTFPTFKRCLEIGQEEAIREGFVGKVFLLGITELSKEDFETFLSENK